MASNTIMIHKLQQAINTKGYNILYSTAQFYSKKQDRPITIYQIKQAYWDEDAQRMSNKELFSSASQLQIVLYLRDLWYDINGWEIPKDNETWNEKKPDTNNLVKGDNN